MTRPRCWDAALVLLLIASMRGKLHVARGERSAGRRARWFSEFEFERSNGPMSPLPCTGALGAMQAGVYMLEIEPATRGCFARGE